MTVFDGRPDADVVVAAFDVDGTLTTTDTFVRFLRRASGWLRLAIALGSIAPQAVLVIAGRGDRDDVKRRVVRRTLGGANVRDIERHGHDHAREIEERWLRADTVARLRWHQRQGHRVVLVSASLRPYLGPLARSLGVDDVLCTELAVDGDRLSGELTGDNCRGPEKAARLLAWSGGTKPAILWAYGDSAGDDALLALADCPVRVRRGQYVAEVPRDTQETSR